MTVRVLLALALVASLSPGRARLSAQAAAGAAAQTPAKGDDVAARDLLTRVELALRSGDPAAYVALLTPGADQAKAVNFAAAAFRRGASRVVVQERERTVTTRGTTQKGYRLILDMFAEFGDKARIGTWQLDAEPSAEGHWSIANQEMLSTVEELYRLSVTRSRQFEGKNFTVYAEDLGLTLVNGTVFTVDADGETTGLVLLGQGEMRFEPTPETEKGQVRIFAGDTAVVTRFDAAYVRLGSASGHFDPATLTERPVDARDLKRAEQVFREESSKSFVLELGDLSRDPWSLLPGPDDFLAEVRTRRYGTLTYARSANEPEDISFFDRRRQRNISVYASADKLAARGRFYDEDALAAYDVLHYDIDLDLQPDRRWLEGTTTMRLRVKTIAANQITLRLADSLVVHSVLSDRFGRLFTLRAKGQNTVLVNLPAALMPNSELSLTIDYAGRLEPQAPDRETAAPQQSDTPAFGGGTEMVPTVTRGEPNYLYSNRSYWYPQAPITDYATAVMHITVPSPFVCVASGTLQPNSPVFVSAVGSQPGKLYMFRVERPLRYLSFVVSRFERGEPASLTFEPRTLPASTLTETRAPSGLMMMIATAPVPPPPPRPAAPPAVYTMLSMQVEANPRQTGRGKDYLSRAEDIARFYDSIIGDIPYDSFTMALIEHTTPGGHSPGYFAVLNQPLPNTGLFWRDDPAAFEGYPEFFLAHELAHQWWGQAVGWRNYHEQWLSEGFAQYFAAMYAGHLRGPDAFGSVLRQMRKWAIDTSPQGPVYLGYRLGHIRNEGRVHRALVYNKGGAVLHMLRRLIGDEPFFRGLRRFYADGRYRKSGTEDLRLAMEAESGRPLTRFFERWIYGAALPVLKLSTRVETGAAGPELVIHVEQEGELFDVPLPLTLAFTDRPSTDVVVPVTEQVVDTRIALAGTLRSVEVNKSDGILADVIRMP